MTEVYMGVDVGSISTKGVLVSKTDEILAHDYIYTEGNPIEAVRRLVKTLTKDKDLEIVGVGTTGSARKLAGTMLTADLIKNEITAHAAGTISLFPDVRTIFEIGGQDSKIIIINNGIVTDYAMNTLCAAGTGSFLSSQAKRLGVEVEDFGTLALQSSKPAAIAARCTVFAESDLVHKAQIGYKKEDIIAGLCNAVATNYLNNLSKGKYIKSPIVFQGGVSKNVGVIKAFENLTKESIIVDCRGHLMGALGVAVLCKRSNINHKFDPDSLEQPFETKGGECAGCANNCELINIFKCGKLIDVWGARCGKTS